MRGAFLVFPIILSLTSAVAVTVSEDKAAVANAKATVADGNDCSNAPERKGRHIHEFVHIPATSKKQKRQVIRIPAGVSTVKLVQPPLNLRHNRAPQQFSRYSPTYRGGVSWMPPNKRPRKDSHFEPDNPFLYDPKNVKRNLKKSIVTEVSPEEFYRDDAEAEFNQEKRKEKKSKKYGSMVKIKRKKPKQNVLGEYLAQYEGNGEMNQEEGGGGFGGTELRFLATKESHPLYGYDPAGSAMHIKQVPPPDLLDPSTNNPFANPHALPLPDKNYVPALKIKNLPTKGRQAQSMFSQQYTTHNPHVTTNFGLPQLLHYGTKPSPPGTNPPLDSYSHPVAAATDHVPRTPAIRLIQPPHFRDVTVSHPSHPSRLMSGESDQKEETSSQKATIRDILEQDCASHEAKGYCDSPPRYPMHQIKNMLKKCADLMDAMNTQPFEDPQEVLTFAKRADDLEAKGNKSLPPVDLGVDSFSSWSRSAADGFAACNSDVELLEPGYAREVNSGRWFVIVQHPDTTIQRIATDTCRSPGKPCGGLSEMKCLKVNSLANKSTRCIQRHTNQRLISWDPESPEDCPRMRVFRFPSACNCHLELL